MRWLIANEIQVPVSSVHDEAVFPDYQLEIIEYVLADVDGYVDHYRSAVSV